MIWDVRFMLQYDTNVRLCVNSVMSCTSWSSNTSESDRLSHVFTLIWSIPGGAMIKKTEKIKWWFKRYDHTRRRMVRLCETRRLFSMFPIRPTLTYLLAFDTLQAVPLRNQMTKRLDEECCWLLRCLSNWEVLEWRHMRMQLSARCLAVTKVESDEANGEDDEVASQ